MWVEKTKNGKFKFVEQYQDYMTGKKSRVYVTMDKNTKSTRKTAEQLLTRMIDEHQKEEAEKKENITLADLVEKYMEYQKITVKESTWRRNYFQCKAAMEILGGDVLINRLTANYIKERFIKTGQNASTLNERRIRLLALLRWGYENDYLEDVSFLRKFKPFKDNTRKEKIQDKYLEPEELRALLQKMDVEKWRLLTRFLVLSGLRIGEALALHAADIDFKNKVIRVSKTYDANNRIETTPKTLCSLRDVYMQPELEGVCREILVNTKLEMLSGGFRTDLFICGREGEHLNPFSYNKYLRGLSERTIGRRITAHALRHTHASLLLASGVNIETIARRLGHENSQVTREIYLHVTKKLVESDNEQIRNARLS